MEPSIIQEYGYTWVALPKESLLPLTLLEKGKAGFFRRLFNLSTTASGINSTIFDLFPKPLQGKSITLEPAKKAPFFNGFDMSKKGAGLSVKGLKGLQGVGNVDAEGSLDQASMLLYSFKSPVVIGIHTEVLLEEHLNLTPVNANVPGFLDKLRNGELYVVTEVLQCQEFSVEDGSSFKIDGNANVETLNGQLGEFKGSGTVDNKLSKVLTYMGTAPLTFALKARQIKVRELNGKTQYGLFEATLKQVRSGLHLEVTEIPESGIFIE
jgi:hypothetical protein